MSSRIEPTLPTQRSRFGALGGAVTITIASVALQATIVDRAFVSMDEGHLVATAQRLLRGDLLYRDIHTGIFPGIYYLTALLFELFGHDVIVTRWAQVVVNSSIALTLWLVGLRMLRPRWAALAPLLYLSLIPVGFPGLTMLNYSTVSMAFGLAALLFLLRYLEGARARDAVWAGVWLACCALSKQNFGALAGLALLIGFLWGRRDSLLAGRSALAGLAPVVLGGGAVTLLGAAWFLATGTLPDLIDSTFTQLLSTQLESFDHPIPAIFDALPLDDGLFTFLYSPPALFGYLIHGEKILGQPVSPLMRGTAIRLSYGLPLAALILAPVVLWRNRARDTGGERRASRMVAVFAGLLFLGIFPSAIWSHLAFTLPPILLVMVWIADRLDRELMGSHAVAARWWRGLAGVSVLAFVLVALRIPDDIRRWNPVPLALPRASVYVAPDQAALYQGASAFLEQCAEAGEPVFVAPTLPLLYFVTNRPNPTRYDLTIPGDVQGDRIIRDLEASQTRCVVYDPVMYLEFPPFEQIFPELAGYLEQHGYDERFLNIAPPFYPTTGRYDGVLWDDGP